ncbi:hypothetical protein B0H63DRAFT_519835 [Podospora didyma]|uniref:Rhodanese domain-containing protein n=1 Tax=Podospora didyma TaxID=330526 RepID=A0AAE0U4Y5_9PEZI|nr:hypothetical protein B0H63DRAFT_519835 [Podospora didyma]
MSTSRPKNIVIAGGVAGGMSCATRLRRLDEHANITVIEKGPYISYANCGIPYALGGVIESDVKLHVTNPQKIESWFNVNVRTNTELVSIDRAAKTVSVRHWQSPGGPGDGESQVSTLPYDNLILALGAEPLMPPIEGVHSSHVFNLITIPDLQHIQQYIRTTKAHTAVVIGGAFIGLEAAENLQFLGLDVTVVEHSAHIFPIADADMVRPLEDELVRYKVKLLTSTSVTKITPPTSDLPGMLYLTNHDPLQADIVIVAAGIRSRTSIPAAAGLAVGKTGVSVNEFMQTSDPCIYAVGDMVETYHRVLGQNVRLALAGPANRQGRLAADHIAGRKTVYRGNIGTAICKVFGQTIGIVGLSRKQLDTIPGLKHEFVTVHPPNHAGYYPGSQKLVVRVHFDRDTGHLLGGQVTGPDGADKQTDVLAVAITAGMSVEDLEHLELAYAPPFGSAKDPINMVGFVAGNVMRGDVEVAHPADFATGRQMLGDYLVLDVRSVGEFEAGHVAGAVNIPLGELRDRLSELDKSRKILSYCMVGYRGYVACRILKQEGFEVTNLDGGYRAVKMGGYSDDLQVVPLRQ